MSLENASASTADYIGPGGSSGADAAQTEPAARANDSGAASLLTSLEAAQDERPGKGADDAQAAEAAETSQKPENSKDSDPAAVVPAKAEDYQITFADGVNVNENSLNSFRATAHALGISQGQAQGLVDFFVQHEAKRSEEHFRAAAEMKQDWEREIMSSPTFRKDAGEARKTLVTFGSFGTVNERGEPAIHPEIKNIFDESLVGSHPKVFQMFVEIGKALAEPEARGRGVGSGRERPLADRLWPNMK